MPLPNSSPFSSDSAPGPIGWLEMTAQPLPQFRTVALGSAPDCRMVRLQAALTEQLFDITE